MKSIISKLLISFAFIALIVLSSCKQGVVYSDSRKIPGYSWAIDSIITFSTSIEDTVSAFDINLVIRTDKDYPYRNIFMFIGTSSPANERIRDTVEYYLADQKGNWYGSGLGDINGLTVPFKTNVRFPYPGTYTFRIQQGMRDQSLKGVTDIGIFIEKRTQ